VVEVVVADQPEPTAGVRVVGVAGRLVLVISEIVRHFLGESLVERFVVLCLDPFLGGVDNFVTVVIADLVGVEFLLGLERDVVEVVTRHVAHVARHLPRPHDAVQIDHLEFASTWEPRRPRLTQKRCAPACLLIEFTRPYLAVWYGEQL